MRKTKDQADKRHTEQMPDQHGRMWDVCIERGTMTSVGLWPKFKAPVMPPAPYVQSKRLGKVEIDYDAWLAENLQQSATYEQTLLILKQDPGIRASGENPKVWAGIPPFPRVVIEACRKGSAWALGLSDVKPKWLTKQVEAQLNGWRQNKSAPIAPLDDTVFDDAPSEDVDELTSAPRAVRRDRKGAFAAA